MTMPSVRWLWYRRNADKGRSRGRRLPLRRRAAKRQAAGKSPGQFGLDRLDQRPRLGLHARIEPADDLAVLADQELVEVPLYRPGELRVRLRRREEVVQRRLPRALDDDFLRHRERDAVVLAAELRDLLVAARLLA